MIYNLNQIIKSISDYLPSGVAWNAKRVITSNTYLFLKSIAEQIKIFFSDLVKLKDEMDPYTTIDLIDRHEKECGIPDDIFTVLNTLEERRANVILKNAGLNISTLQEFRNLSSLLGYSLSIDSASSIRFPPYDVPFYPLPVGGCYFLIVIRGNISIVNISYFVNFMEKLLPANCGLLLIDTSV